MLGSDFIYAGIPPKTNRELEELRTVIKVITSPWNEFDVIPFPILAYGLIPGIVWINIEEFGNDIVLHSGSAIIGHPGGVKAFKQAIEAKNNGVLIEKAIEKYKELRVSCEVWGYLKEKKYLKRGKLEFQTSKTS